MTVVTAFLGMDLTGADKWDGGCSVAVEAERDGAEVMFREAGFTVLMLVVVARMTIGTVKESVAAIGSGGGTDS